MKQGGPRGIGHDCIEEAVVGLEQELGPGRVIGGKFE